MKKLIEFLFINIVALALVFELMYYIYTHIYNRTENLIAGLSCILVCYMMNKYCDKFDI